MVAGAGFEPTTFGLWARRATKLLHPAIEVGYSTHFKINCKFKFKNNRVWLEIVQNSHIISVNLSFFDESRSNLSLLRQSVKT